ncbi:polyketide synthase [Trichoderma citrinoviride]|uniref:Polyketide synthase n=1 Tax=Trichoderma citrinoviride TaxID=58853 RepID=A0A2T4B1X7_9HYPO|nr:polyketide synthase [Trichoderma citrinoviride]PTB63211.1 polyketide synthase [Trichoderma citrinoviride]
MATMEPLAIIGMACQFPQEGDNNENFWKMLMTGKSAMTPVPKNRFNMEGHFHPDVEHGGTFHVKGAHFMAADPAEFDNQFFSIPKSEVMSLDPQQRLLMENVYHALENAGIPMDKAVGSNTSVFSSGFNHDYLQLLNSDPEIKLKYKPMGTSNSILSGRISWFFDFKGPSLTVDTACSSSMVAFHLGAQSLRDHESDMTVICGVNVFTYPTDWFGMDHHGFFAGDGKSYSFDHRASGYSRGEGVATVLVKRLSTALRDGDTIRAVVRATGLNQDGRTPGITLPSAAAQEQMIREVYKRGGLDIAQTAYIEAHATGTAAGDPIEARAIANSFNTANRGSPLIVGAVKSAIGHTEGASGLAGIIKSVMVLESAMIPPNTNFEKVNPKIPIDKWRLQLPLRPTPWPSPGLRQVSINSFGFSGTNGHVVLQDARYYLEEHNLLGFHKTVPYPAHANGSITNGTGHVNGHSANGHGTANGTVNDPTGENGDSTADRTPLIFPVSSFDEQGVQRNANSLATYLNDLLLSDTSSKTRKYFQDLAYTLAAKRTAFQWRSFCLANSVADLAKTLTADSSLAKPVRTRATPNIAFVFTGQGAQWYAMGRELLAFSTFKESIESASQYMQELGSSWSLYDELQRDQQSSQIDKPYLAHPSCTAIQVALVDLLSSWNLRPTRVVGHSSGEIAAAYCAGKISRQSAWKVAYFRGHVSSKVTTNGSMLAVGLTTSELREYLDKVDAKLPGELTLACYNSPKNHTISGDTAKIDELKRILDEKDIFARKLKVKTAYHSSHMRAVAYEYLSLLGDMEPSDADMSVDMYSSVTGARVEDAITSQYWVDNLVSPVRFTDALLKMTLESPKSSLRVNSSNSVIQEIVEVGPHSALRSAIKETLTSHFSENLGIGYHAVLDRNTPGVETLLKTVGNLFSRGSVVDLALVNQGALRSPSDGQPSMIANLPPYAFNHSQTTWYESRLSRNYRFRKYPRHDLFGAPVPDWNPEEPVWRNFIRISEQPWLRDHVVTSSIVYPGVGYIIMAIEASRQIASPDLKLLGFHLKDISIKSALIVPDNKEGIEVKFSMVGMDESSLEKSKVWRKWTVTSYNTVADNWVEHCTGYIQTQYDVSPGPIDEGLEEASEVLASKKLLQDSVHRCTTPTSINYDNLDTVGLHFGPLFQNLSDVVVNKGQGEVSSLITVPDVAKVMPKNFLHPHMIHPSTLDSMMHLFIAGVLDITDKKTLESPMVPTFIKDVRISANIENTAGHRFRGFGVSKLTGFQKFHSDITIWDEKTNTERIAVRGWSGKSLGSEVSSIEAKKLCHIVEWMPDLNLVKQPKLKAKLASDQENEEYRQNVRRLQLASVLFVMLALEDLKDYPVDKLEGHFKNYYAWCIKVRDDLHKGLLPHLDIDEWKRYMDSESLREALFSQIEEYNADGRLLVRTGKALAAVMRKEIDPLQLMFGQDNILDELYRNMVESGNLPALLKAYLEIVHHNNVNLNIMEIGAGTGSLSAPVLEALGPSAADEERLLNDSAIAKYTYTDVSSAFFEKAKDKFKRWRNVLEFKTFNIENEALDQGFEQGTYDFIFAGNVIHATADLEKVLANLRSLLKPGGKLVMHEGIRQATILISGLDLLWLPLSFGQLKGWWLSVEANRKFCPSISEREWDVMLRQAGFTGITTVLTDREVADIRGQSIMVAENNEVIGAQDANRRVHIISSAATQSLATALHSRITNDFGYKNCSIVGLSDLSDRELIYDTCISLIDLERPLLADFTEQQYNDLNHLIATSDGVLWLSGDFQKDPAQYMITGVIRTVRWERDLDAPNLITMSVAEPRPDDDIFIESILSVFKHQFVNDIDDGSKNAEYYLKDYELLTNRLIDAQNVNGFVHSNFAEADPKQIPLGEAGRPIMLDTSSPGSLSALHFATDPVWARPMGENEVEVEVRAVGLNFRDVLIAMGEHVAACLGNEAAGYVSRIGSKVTNVRVGDRVVYMNGLVDGGCLKTYGRQSADAVVKLPDSVSFEDAASLPCVYSTVIHGLYDIARLSEGETVLIHAAAGGVGQAAIQLANLVGAEIFATVSTPEKRDLLINEYGVKKDHIFSSRDLSFVKGIKRMTNDRGIDVVLNSLSGDALRASWDVLAPFGRFIEIGKKDAQANGRIDLSPLLRQTVMASVDLTTIMHYKPKKLGQLIAETVRLFAEGKVKLAKPTRVLNYTQIEEAFRSLQSGKSMGKTVFKPEPTDIVPIMPERSSPLQFDQNASYVLAGGLGGLGRSIARWMVSRGAKHLIFISRSGAASESAQELVQELEAAGCKVYVFACDVSDEAALSKTIDDCKARLPEIKGCVQGSMVLRDSMFENMSYENFQAALRPKFQGSWNLHKLLPTSMDFFLLLSSATGVLGNRSQANYAAGNTYQDALATHRRCLGLPATSIDLGSILSVGYVAENKTRLKTIPTISSVLESIREDEIHLIIEYHLDRRYPGPSQTVSGLPNVAMYKQRRMPVPSYLYLPMFRHLQSETSTATEAVEDDPLLLIPVQLAAATKIEEAVAVVSNGIRLKLSKLLSMAADDIDPGKSISSNGVDSLVATEFRTWLGKTLKADLPMLDIMGTSSILTFSEKVVSLSKLVQITASS